MKKLALYISIKMDHGTKKSYRMMSKYMPSQVQKY